METILIILFVISIITSGLSGILGILSVVFEWDIHEERCFAIALCALISSFVIASVGAVVYGDSSQ